MVLFSKSWKSTIRSLEKKVANFADTKYSIICNSGRSAIFYSLLALGIKQSDEVIIPDYSSQILPLTVFCTGAISKFCDIQRKTLTLSPEDLLKIINSNTKAIIFVAPYGLPIDPSPILEIVRKRKIAFINDCAQAFGATLGGKCFASFGDVGILSFNKFLNIHSGAAVVTDQQEISGKIKLIRDYYEKRSLFAEFNYRIMDLFGLRSKKMIRKTFWRDNYFYTKKVNNAKKYFRLTNDGWVIGNSELNWLRRSGKLPHSLIIQLWGSYGGRYYYRRRLEKLELLALDSELENLPKYLNMRKINARTYEKGLKKEFRKFVIPSNSEASYLRYPILFSNKKKCSVCIDTLINEGFKMYYYYKPLHESPFFSMNNRNHQFPESIYVSNHLLLLPVDSDLSAIEIERILSIVNSAVDSYE